MSNNHGLSVHTTDDARPGADTADNRRLQRPVAEEVNNAFNDATSGKYYKHRSGHEGIDFLSYKTEVKAMYGGVVSEVRYDPISYGNLVTIRSCTNPNDGTGFEHSYAHLDSVAVEKGDPIRKGQVIGRSGNTPNVDFHLHVHLRAFGPDGVVIKDENIPARGEDNQKVEGTDLYENSITRVASRIIGCLNFACFLPPDDAGLPAIDGKALDHTGKLLSPRAADAETSMPVYREIFTPSRTTPPNRTLLPEADLNAAANLLGTIESSRLGCYAVLQVLDLGNRSKYFNTRGLTGSIPPELGQLTQLQVLDLGGNSLTGCIPPALVPVCECPSRPRCE